MRNPSYRAQGQALAEGVVALVLIISATVGAVALLFNTGMLVYDQEKLGFICQQSSNFALGQSSKTVQSATQTFAQNLGTSMGLPIDTKNVTVTPSSSPTQVTVAITAQAPLFFGVFGSLATIKDNATSVTQLDQFHSYDTVLQIPLETGGAFLIPAWNGGAPDVIFDVLPQTTFSGSLGLIGVKSATGNTAVPAAVLGGVDSSTINN